MSHAARILDANGNRAAEGLRVLEDIALFTCNHLVWTEIAKQLRHTVRQAIPANVIQHRDTANDVGTTVKTDDELVRARPLDLLRANAARIGEALRAAEEAAKLLGYGVAAAALESARYQTYSLESGLLACFPAHRLAQVKLYALVDTSLTDRPIEVAAAVAQGGAGAVQLRAKNLGVRAYRDLAARIGAAIHHHDALLVINDHVAVAAALHADAVHIGQDDLSIADTRTVVGMTCAIGLSCHTPEQVDAAQADGADYLGLGPMYATTTKPHEPCRGPELLDAVRERLNRPSYAIGGLDAERLQLLKPRLPHGVAVAGALCRSADPQRTAAELRALLDG